MPRPAEEEVLWQNMEAFAERAKNDQLLCNADPSSLRRYYGAYASIRTRIDNPTAGNAAYTKTHGGHPSGFGENVRDMGFTLHTIIKSILGDGPDEHNHAGIISSALVRLGDEHCAKNDQLLGKADPSSLRRYYGAYASIRTRIDNPTPGNAAYTKTYEGYPSGFGEDVTGLGFALYTIIQSILGDGPDQHNDADKINKVLVRLAGEHYAACLLKAVKARD